jgi:hypothetical protein
MHFGIWPNAFRHLTKCISAFDQMHFSIWPNAFRHLTKCISAFDQMHFGIWPNAFRIPNARAGALDATRSKLFATWWPFGLLENSDVPPNVRARGRRARAAVASRRRTARARGPQTFEANFEARAVLPFEWEIGKRKGLKVM